jgi:hypothetical protein
MERFLPLLVHGDLSFFFLHFKMAAILVFLDRYTDTWGFVLGPSIRVWCSKFAVFICLFILYCYIGM